MSLDAASPTVSVIIAAYNVEAYIERAIASALSQQGVAVEIILVDDCSTDRTWEITSKINDTRLKCIRLPQNSGPSIARNAGIAAATAPWIAILDGDDAFLPGRLGRLMSRAHGLNADVVVDNITILREDGGARFPMFKASWLERLNVLDIATFIGKNQMLQHGHTLGYMKPLFSKDFLTKHSIHYTPTLKIGEDYMFLLEALAKGAICAVEQTPGYQYTVRKNSISHRLSCDDIIGILDEDKTFLTRVKLDHKARKAQKKREKSLIKALAYTQLVDAIKQKNFIAALKTIKIYPLAGLQLLEPIWVRVKRLFTYCLKSKSAERLEDLLKRKVILLFFKEIENDSYFKYDRYLKRILRPFYHLTHRRQKKSGFAVSFELMCRALQKSGYEVRVNDYKTAQCNPTYPVGIVGFPIILDGWLLPNPAILGPSLYDHPMLAPNLMEDSRFKRLAVLAPWTLAMYAQVYGDACFSWFAGIDLEQWPDLSSKPKSYDFLVYDKIRWDHDKFEESLLNPILKTLEAKGITYKVVRYKMYDHAVYRELLSSSRAMLFICEHETQGLAYQEAMASGIPILAWDRGIWADPLWKRFASSAPPASSVPFFSDKCGERFRDIYDFENALNRFMRKLGVYAPREYVGHNLSMEISAKLYADEYFSLMPRN